MYNLEKDLTQLEVDLLHHSTQSIIDTICSNSEIKEAKKHVFTGYDSKHNQFYELHVLATKIEEDFIDPFETQTTYVTYFANEKLGKII